jgi:hypothetical protein
MKHSGTDLEYFYVDGYNLAPAMIDNFTVSRESLTEQTNPFGVESEQHSPIGMEKGTITLTGGLYDESKDPIHTSLVVDPVGVSRIMAMLISGGAAGSMFIGFMASYTQKFDVLVQRANITRANVQYLVSGYIEEGQVVQTPATYTADWDTKTGGVGAPDAPVDYLLDPLNTGGDTSSPDGGVGYLQVTGFSGFSGVIVKIMHSPDDITYAAKVTFATVVAANTKERVEVAGVVDRYLSSNGDVTGAGSITLFTGFSRNL